MSTSGAQGTKWKRRFMMPDKIRASGDPRFKPGFQLSVLDVIVLIAGTWGSWFMGREVWWAGVMVGFVVGHFFLFCNVFRISRASELIWAAAVVILSGATIAMGFPGWPATF